MDSDLGKVTDAILRSYETGGGIKNVEDLLNDGPFIVYNGDILTDLDLSVLRTEASA